MKLRLTVGSILKKHGAWHWRYYEERKQKSVKLADVDDQHRSKQDVIPMANELAARRPRNDDRPSSNLSIVAFGDSVYFPWVKDTHRPATYDAYHKVWAKHLRGHFGDRQLCQY